MYLDLCPSPKAHPSLRCHPCWVYSVRTLNVRPLLLAPCLPHSLVWSWSSGPLSCLVNIPSCMSWGIFPHSCTHQWTFHHFHFLVFVKHCCRAIGGHVFWTSAFKWAKYSEVKLLWHSIVQLLILPGPLPLLSLMIAPFSVFANAVPTAAPPLGVHPEQLESRSQRCPHFRVSCSTVPESKVWTWAKCPQTDEWIRQT